MAEPRPKAQHEFGHYVLLAPLGKGGIGEVWKAKDKRLGRIVALKFVTQVREGSTASDDLFREARAASVLNHPNIVTVLDIGESDLGCYISMEFVDGESLRARLASGPMAFEDAMQIFRQAAEGLAVAHRRGIVHRDLKPENIMLRADGYVKLVDFGLAKVLPWANADEGGSETPTAEFNADAHTEPGLLVGTFRYMSPEQARGLQLTPASDIFSLGIVMHECLTGEHPFQGKTTMDALHAILAQEAESVQKKCPEAPPEVSSAITRALQKDPSHRFSSAVEMASALAEISSVMGKSNAPKVTHQPRWMKLIGASLLAVVLAAGIWTAAAPGGGKTATIVRTEAIESIAVVNFRAPAADAQAQEVAQFLPEDINMRLGKAGFRVAATSKGMAVTEGEDPQSVGARLGVDAVLQGTVRSQGQRLRLRMELVSTATGFQLWNATITVDAADLVNGNEKLVNEVAEQIKAAIGGGR